LSEAELQFLNVGAGPRGRAIAFRKRAERASSKPGLVWLCGFKSDMASTKAQALDAACAASGQGLLRFDYSGHGESGGRFEDGSISDWLEESLALIRAQTVGPQILVGSSMGGYLALLVARALKAAEETTRLAGLVLIAPAVDFTEALIWRRASPEARRAIERDGVFLRPSPYGPEPYPITRLLLDDGRRHLLLERTIRSHCPVRILQGMQDEDVPYQHTLALVEHMAGDRVTLTLVKDGDHRLSRPQDLALLLDAIESLS